MVTVTLAIPWNGNAAGSVISVTAAVARQLVYDGVAVISGGGPATGNTAEHAAWAPSTFYRATMTVTTATGGLITRFADGTSRSTFDATEAALWTVDPNAAYVAVFKPEAYGALGYATLATAQSSGTDNTAALNACFAAAVAVGGTVALGPVYYPYTGQLAVAGGCSIVGAGCQEVSMGSGYPQATPWLTGSVLVSMGAGNDGLRLTGKAASVYLEGFGIVFGDSIRFTNTGHGVLGRTSTTFSSGHDLGPYNCAWRNVKVFGHDGNHYGFVLTNALEIETSGLRSYGGGVMRVEADSTVICSGNQVHTQPFGSLFVSGTADAFSMSALTSAPGGLGGLNLMVWLRPQVNFIDASAIAALGNPTKPSSSMKLWNDLAGGAGLYPTRSVVLEPDLESDISAQLQPFTFAPAASTTTTTVIVRGGLVNGTATAPYCADPFYGPSQNSNLGMGLGSLQALTSGTGNIALGVQALNAITGDTGNVAVGNATLKAATGTVQSVAVGSQALTVATGAGNVAVGYLAMWSSTTAAKTVAVGFEVLLAGIGGANNTAIGYEAGYVPKNVVANASVGGSNNTYIGYQTGAPDATDPSSSTAVGASAVAKNQATALGQNAAATAAQTTAIGQGSTASGALATALGIGVTAGAAGAVAIGADSGGTSASTATANAFVLGTTNHTIVVPGLPSKAFVSGDKYVIADSTGHLHLSALGPAS